MEYVIKKKLAALAFCLLLVMSVVLCGCSQNVEANKNRKINSVNHRGYGDAPENTLSAYRLSKEMGFTMVECDVCFTKDGQAVLLHDDTVNRTSNINSQGKVKISDLTLAEARELDFGSWKNDKYKGEKIPTYQEFIDLCVELELYPYIEIKNGATEEQVASLAEVVANSELTTVTWIARNIDFLSQLAEIRPNDRLGLIVNIVSSKSIKALAEIDKGRNLCFIDVWYSLLTIPQINSCKKSNMPLEVWTLDDKDKIANIDPYITGVTSNFVNSEKLFETL